MFANAEGYSVRTNGVKEIDLDIHDVMCSAMARVQLGPGLGQFCNRMALIS